MDRLHQIYNLEHNLLKFTSQELADSPASFIKVWQTRIKLQRNNSDVPVEKLPVVVVIETAHINKLKLGDWLLVVEMLEKLKPRIKYLSVRGEDDDKMKMILGKFERWRSKSCTLVGVEVDYTGSRNCTKVTFESLGGLLKRAAPTLEYLLLRRITYGFRRTKTNGKNSFELKQLTHLRVEEPLFSPSAKTRNAQNEIAEMYVKPSAPTLDDIKLSELVLDDSLVTPYVQSVLEKVVENSRDDEETCLDDEAEDYFSDDGSGPLNFGHHFQDALPDSGDESDDSDGFAAVEFSQATNVLSWDDEPVVPMSQAMKW